MRKISAIFLSVLFLLIVFVQKGCVKSTEPDTFEAGVEIISPSNDTEYLVGQEIPVTAKLSGYTFEYSEIRYYFGESETPAAVFSKAEIEELAETQEKDAEFTVNIPTESMTAGGTNLTVEALDSYSNSYTAMRTISFFVPYATVLIDITDPVDTDQLIQGETATFQIDLESPNGLEYFDEIILYLNDVRIQDPIPLDTQDSTYTFDHQIESTGLETGNYEFKVVLNSIGDESVEGTKDFAVIEETSTLDLTILSPDDALEFNLGERIEVEVQIEGNLTHFKSLSAYIGDISEPIYESADANEFKTFDFATGDYSAGDYTLKVKLTNINDISQTKELDFTLIEYIPTFVKEGEEGYALKSVIQTFDNGYLTVASDEANGTRVVKYDKEGELLWSENIAANVGIAESVCEDTDYDKGYVLAGWRMDGSIKDTWLRKIDHNDGSLIWNKHFGYDHCDDGATVIKKSIDDGYVIGGWTYNYLGTGEYTVSGECYEETYTLDTGYDVRLLKVYSNGNEVWGYNRSYVSHRQWRDITGHKDEISCIDPDTGDEITEDYLYIRKMGDQYITDLQVKEDGNYIVTGWNNHYLYNSGSDASKKDMFYAEFDFYGGFVNGMTWARMGAYDTEHLAGEDDFDPYINVEIVNANALGDFAEDEVGYGLVESHGGYGGDVVMAGSTFQDDDRPVKERLNDGWVVEFGISSDEDGALWEYSFGQTGKDDMAYGIDRTKDGGYIVTGYRTETDRDTWLFKLDSTLSLLWSKKNLGITGQDTGVKVLQTSDGGFVIGA
ncbi:MAG: hypothetical protein R6V47_04675, partial [Candidatus Delongbacteria bacterium]